MKMYHYSAEPLRLSPKTYSAKQYPFKPCGLWLTTDGDDSWKNWCLENDFNIEDLAHQAEVEIDTSNILILNTSKDMKQFTEKFKSEEITNPNSLGINWTKVMETYCGIIIPIYFWELRLKPEFFWYYTWDCASACIWDLSKLTVL